MPATELTDFFAMSELYPIDFTHLEYFLLFLFPVYEFCSCIDRSNAGIFCWIV